MFRRQGFTLMEMIVVLVIMGIIVAVAFPNFNAPTERARAANALNNLLAVYSAQRNYINNNGAPCPIASLSEVNSKLFLNIQDDGTYKYECGTTANVCTATRTSPLNSLVIKVSLNAPIQANQNNANPNPLCTPSAGNANWCE